MNADGYFRITVIDEETGRGVPMVEIKTTGGVRYYTDSNGIIAFKELTLMDREVFFYVRSHGYEFMEEYFGERGRVLHVVPGGGALLKVRRINIAERLYRVTGEGIYLDSVLVGHPVPIRNPLINGRVTGQDTVIATPYRGRIYWFWGDTFGPADLNTAVSGATSEWPGNGGMDPDIGVDLTYFTDERGFSKEMCRIPGPGRVWLDWVMPLKDREGVERLVAQYSCMKSLSEAHERGIAVFDDARQSFERIAKWCRGLDAPHTSTHPFLASKGGEDFLYFTSKFRFRRVRADLEHVLDPAGYESFTCLKPGGRYNKADPPLDLRSDGTIIHAWKPDTDPVDYDAQQEMIATENIMPEQGWLYPHDIDTGLPIAVYPGSVFWNGFRGRWIMVAQREIGEIWYAEADTITGPWVYCKRIVTHNQYTFYNVTQHPYFDKAGGRIIYFEGTYTNWFSGNPDQTPRYDYNQIMYRLRLDDQRLYLPVPVYRLREEDGSSRFLLREGVDTEDGWAKVEEIPFFAFPPGRSPEGLMPVFAGVEDGEAALRLNPFDGTEEARHPLFYALPAVTLEFTLMSTWQCRARGPDGSELPFLLAIEAREGSVAASFQPASISAGSVHINRGRLQLEILYERNRYRLTAGLKRNKLTGEWERCDTGERGEWEGSRGDFAWLQSLTPSVVPLFEYRRGRGRARLYSTRPNLKGEMVSRSHAPLCRVWRNPAPMLILDYETKPLE